MKTLKNPLLVSIALVLTISVSSCKKVDELFVIDSEALYYDMDSVPKAGVYTKKGVAKYDIDEFCKQNSVPKEAITEMKLSKIDLIVESGDLNLDEYKYVKVSVSVDGSNLPVAQIVDSTVIPAGTKKSFTLLPNNNVDLLRYVTLGDVTMTMTYQTANNHTHSGRIHGIPHIDVGATIKKKFGL